MRGDPGTRWYRVHLPRADTFSTWAPGSAVVTLAIPSPNGKAEFGWRTAHRSPGDSGVFTQIDPGLRRFAADMPTRVGRIAAANRAILRARCYPALTLSAGLAAERVHPGIDNNLIASACRASRGDAERRRPVPASCPIRRRAVQPSSRQAKLAVSVARNDVTFALLAVTILIGVRMLAGLRARMRPANGTQRREAVMRTERLARGARTGRPVKAAAVIGARGRDGGARRGRGRRAPAATAQPRRREAHAAPAA